MSDTKEAYEGSRVSKGASGGRGYRIVAEAFKRLLRQRSPTHEETVPDDYE